MMIMPVRLQIRRVRGFEMQQVSQAANGLAGACIARSTEWGNPYVISKVKVQHPDGRVEEEYSIECSTGFWFRQTKAEANELAVNMFAAWAIQPSKRKWLDRARLALKGKNLFCWCPTGLKCHGDELLRLVNP